MMKRIRRSMLDDAPPPKSTAFFLGAPGRIVRLYGSVSPTPIKPTQGSKCARRSNRATVIHVRSIPFASMDLSLREERVRDGPPNDLFAGVSGLMFES